MIVRRPILQLRRGVCNVGEVRQRLCNGSDDAPELHLCRRAGGGHLRRLRVCPFGFLIWYMPLLIYNMARRGGLSLSVSWLQIAVCTVCRQCTHLHPAEHTCPAARLRRQSSGLPSAGAAGPATADPRQRVSDPGRPGPPAIPAVLRPAARQSGAPGALPDTQACIKSDSASPPL